MENEKQLLELTEEQKEMLRDELCSGVCLFSDHCDGWRYAPYCMLQDSGAYPPFLDK